MSIQGRMNSLLSEGADTKAALKQLDTVEKHLEAAIEAAQQLYRDVPAQPRSVVERLLSQLENALGGRLNTNSVESVREALKEMEGF